jgi:hypothetical protein
VILHDRTSEALREKIARCLQQHCKVSKVHLERVFNAKSDFLFLISPRGLEVGGENARLKTRVWLERFPLFHPPPPARGRSHREKNETIHGSLEWDCLKPDYCAAPSTLNPNSLPWVEGSVPTVSHVRIIFLPRHEA